MFVITYLWLREHALVICHLWFSWSRLFFSWFGFNFFIYLFCQKWEDCINKAQRHLHHEVQNKILDQAKRSSNNYKRCVKINVKGWNCFFFLNQEEYMCSRLKPRGKYPHIAQTKGIKWTSPILFHTNHCRTNTHRLKGHKTSNKKGLILSIFALSWILYNSSNSFQEDNTTMDSIMIIFRWTTQQ